MFNLLAESGTPGSWTIVIILLVVMVAFMFYSNYTQKKRQKETQATLDALQPGNKVKTIGGVCGVVVEVCPKWVVKVRVTDEKGCFSTFCLGFPYCLIFSCGIGKFIHVNVAVARSCFNDWDCGILQC